MVLDILSELKKGQSVTDQNFLRFDGNSVFVENVQAVKFYGYPITVSSNDFSGVTTFLLSDSLAYDDSRSKMDGTVLLSDHTNDNSLGLLGTVTLLYVIPLNNEFVEPLADDSMIDYSNTTASVNTTIKVIS